ncbi:Uncharacterised protein [Mycobacteroides abscessus subsp. abscessus]|nr:Uncharacterised protein [Mycobacteroides abscessus subsp. abscessus]
MLAPVLSKRATSAPFAASSTRTYSPWNWPKVPPSADAAITIVSTWGSTPARFTDSTSSTVGPCRLPSWRTAPEGCAGWL